MLLSAGLWFSLPLCCNLTENHTYATHSFFVFTLSKECGFPVSEFWCRTKFLNQSRELEEAICLKKDTKGRSGYKGYQPQGQPYSSVTVHSVWGSGKRRSEPGRQDSVYEGLALAQLAESGHDVVEMSLGAPSAGLPLAPWLTRSD